MKIQEADFRDLNLKHQSRRLSKAPGKSDASQESVRMLPSTVSEWIWKPTLHHSQKLTQNRSRLKYKTWNQKLLEENTGESSLILVLTINFWTWQTKGNKSKNEHFIWDYIKHKKLLHIRKVIDKMKRRPME